MPVQPGQPVAETASWLRRIAALAVDWLACTLLVIAVVGLDRWNGTAGGYYVLAAYVVESALLGWLAGGSIGKLVTGLRLLPAEDARGTSNPLLALLSLVARQVLVALVIPPLVFKPDGRGLHDLAAGTKTVTVQTQRAVLASRR